MSHLKSTLSGTNTPPENALCVWGAGTWGEHPFFILGYLFHDEDARTWVKEQNVDEYYPLKTFDSFQEIMPKGMYVMVK